PPSFTFKKSGAFTLVGKVKEKGKRIDKEFPGTDGITHSYEETVNYTQDVTVTGNVKITGTHEYQVCDHQQCLRPETRPFTFEITDAGELKDTTGQAGRQAATDSPQVVAVGPAPATDTPKGTGPGGAGQTSGLQSPASGGQQEYTNLWLL